MSATLAGPSDRTSSDRSLARTLALAMGLVFLAVGIVGFFITGFDGFAHHHTDEHLLWFEVNPLHNIVHLVFGVLGVALARTRRGVRTFGLVVGVGYLGALIYGLLAVDETWDFLSINAADNWLHLVLALGGFGLAALAASELRRDEAPARSERPAAGPRQTDADVRSSLNPGGARKDDGDVRGDVDRSRPYDEEPAGLRMEDVGRPQPEPRRR